MQKIFAAMAHLGFMVLGAFDGIAFKRLRKCFAFTQVRPKASWVPDKRQLRWQVADLSPGACVTMQAAFPTEHAGADAKVSH